MNKLALFILFLALVAVGAVVMQVVTYNREVAANDAAIEKVFTDTGAYIDELSEMTRRIDAGLPLLPRLVTCQVCSAQISDQAKACPKCGQPKR
jgi:rubrerythrin